MGWPASRARALRAFAFAFRKPFALGIGSILRKRAPTYAPERDALAGWVSSKKIPPAVPIGATVPLMPKKMQAGLGNNIGLGRWLGLAVESRLRHARRLLGLYGTERHGERGIQLFTPSTLDLDHWLGRSADVTHEQQIELMSLVARALPGRFHAFIGFNPWKAAKDATYLSRIRRAVEREGIVGLKLYPPVGFRPCHNRGLSNLPNGAPRAARSTMPSPTSTGPFWWAEVLRRFPELPLNLGHFGARDSIFEPINRCDFDSSDGWARAIAELMLQYPNVYADVSNFDRKNLTRWLNVIADIDGEDAARSLLQRIMYGSDWFMLALEGDEVSFLADVWGAYEESRTTCRSPTGSPPRGAPPLRVRVESVRRHRLARCRR